MQTWHLIMTKVSAPFSQNENHAGQLGEVRSSNLINIFTYLPLDAGFE